MSAAVSRTSRSSLPPAPGAARLVRARAKADGKTPPVPFGLGGWSEDDAAAAVVVELAGAVEELPLVVAQVPKASTLASGTLVVVLGKVAEASGGGLIARLFRRARTEVSRALRGSALVARGYVDIGATREPSTDHDLVWGYVP